MAAVAVPTSDPAGPQGHRLGVSASIDRGGVAERVQWHERAPRNLGLRHGWLPDQQSRRISVRPISTISLSINPDRYFSIDIPTHCHSVLTPRLLKASKKGFNSPMDGHIWHNNNILYTTATNYIDHAPCANPCPSSIRTYLNGEVKVEPD